MINIHQFLLSTELANYCFSLRSKRFCSPKHAIIQILLLLCILAVFSGRLHGATTGPVTVSGRVLYGAVDESYEGGFEKQTIFDRGLAAGQPVPHVMVQLKTTTGIIVSETLTETDGTFSLETGTTHHTPNLLRIRAENDYVLVKRSKIVPAITDVSIRIQIDIGSEYNDDNDVYLGDIEVDDYDSEHQFTANDSIHPEIKTYPISRAYYVAGCAYRAGRHIEALTSESLSSVVVRMGWGGAAFYDCCTPFVDGTIKKTIHLPGDAAAIMDHEYGHFIEDKIGAFGVFPSYFSHSRCTEGDTNWCWGFLEGLATWYGAVNSQGFITLDDVDFYGNPEDSSHLLALGDNYWIEGLGPKNSDGTCSDRLSWADPRAVEDMTAWILWDLIDTRVDTFDGAASGIPEEAQIDIMDVFNVLTATPYGLLGTTPCSGIYPFFHPVTLEQFCEEYLAQHPELEVYPDLYMAYAFNGITDGCITDTTGPEVVALSSTSHDINKWYNNPTVDLTIVDGADDFSGSFFYYSTINTKSDTEIYATAPELDVSPYGKERVQNVQLGLPDGDGQYIHIQTEDLARHLGDSTAHYGPLRIDTVKPYWNSYDLPGPGESFIIGTYMHFEWDTDDDLSGEDTVIIKYSDLSNGITDLTVKTISADTGSLDFYVNPDIFLPTATGTFSFILSDVAGNDQDKDPNGNTVEATDITIVSPFDGPNSFFFDLENGRVVCGDLNGDGRDEIVISGREALSRKLKVIQISPTMTVQDLSPGLVGGDLFLADTDLDGDLDIVAGGDFGGAGPEVYIFENDGSGGFASSYALSGVPGLDDMVIRVVDLYGTGEPVLVYGGRAYPKIRAYNLRTGVLEILSDVDFRGGDFEVGDINADGIFDFVTLSFDVSGSGTVAWHLGSDTQNQLQWIESGSFGTLVLYPQVGDVDLGNWDDDNDLDLLVMYSSNSPGGPVHKTEVYNWSGATFIKAPGISGAIAEGDGHIVDLYNDGLSDTLALGRRLGGMLSSFFVTNESLGKKVSGVPVPLKNNLMYKTDTAFGDFDGDRDLDMVVTGISGGPGGTSQTLWYENLLSDNYIPNDSPPAPKNLTSFYDYSRNGYVFQWDAPGVGTDETAETAFQYEIRLGHAPGAGNIVSWAHPAGHRQQVAAQLNMGGRLERFVSSPEIALYDWDVRTVDNGWRRSLRSLTCGHCGDAEHPLPVGDLNGDCMINLTDISLFSNEWEKLGCDSGNGWCNGADLDQNSYVDFSDLILQIQQWMVSTAPICY